MTNNSMHMLRCVAHGRIIGPLAVDLQAAGVDIIRGDQKFGVWTKETLDVVIPAAVGGIGVIAGIFIAYINKNKRTRVTWNDDRSIKEIDAASKEELMEILREIKELEIDDL